MELIKFLKNIIRKFLLFPLHLFNKLSIIYSKFLSIIDPNGTECYWEELSQKQIDKRRNSRLRLDNKVQHKSKRFDFTKKINFYTPTKIASWRAKTLFSKELDTLEWIDEHGSEDKILFDIGANIGVYSLYYAQYVGGKVFAFEPSFRNLDLLVRNIKLNNLKDRISVISNPIYDKEFINFFSHRYLCAGEASAAYGEEKMDNNFQTLSLTLDYLVQKNIIPSPNLIKIDVDGNEVEILKGAENTILATDCKTILIETRKNTNEEVKAFLIKSNYKKINNSEPKHRNQIWIKK